MEKLEKKPSTIYDKSYIQWLDQFTLENENYFCNESTSFPERIKEKDIENIKKLYSLYLEIVKYARNNEINNSQYELGDFYKIKLNESGVEIGILKGDPTVFFCERTPLKNEKDFIDFNDIINYNKKNKTRSLTR